MIREQSFSAEEFMKAVSLFGELMEDQNRRYIAEGVPMVSILSNRHVDSAGKPAKIANNATWHTDHTNQEYPPKFTALYPVALPDTGGGTALCNMREAYSTLSDDWKIKIDANLLADASAALGIIGRTGLGKMRHIDTSYLWLQQQSIKDKI